MRWAFFVCLLAASSLGLAACSSSSSGGSCDNIAGTWKVTGECGADTCVVTQNGCATNFACGGGSVAYTGSVSGSSVSYGGKTSSGADGTCSGTVKGSAITGTCTSNGQTCALSAEKQ